MCELGCKALGSEQARDVVYVSCRVAKLQRWRRQPQHVW